MTQRIPLRGGNFTLDPRLDRVFELDWNTLRYPISTTFGLFDKKPRSYTWRVGTWLDQGQEGACVGFGWAHELIAKPTQCSFVDGDYARFKIYKEAQKIDEWAGEAYEGTSVIAGARVCKDQLGLIPEYRWALTVEDAILALGRKGPIVFGFDWHRDMFEPDANGFLHPTGGLMGGHCLLGYGIRIVWKNKPAFWQTSWSLEDLDLDASYIKLWNSWGPTWGDNGTAKLSLRDFMKLFVPNSVDAAVPVQRAFGPIS